MWSVPHADDVIHKTPVQADACRVQGSRYTEDRWKTRSEAFLEGGRSEQRVRFIYLDGIFWPGSWGQLGTRGISLESRQLPVL